MNDRLNSNEGRSDPGAKDDVVTSTLSFPVVGIGASAGGLSALARFFTHMPADSAMAFVVVLHLSPTHPSHAAEVLQRSTSMNVIQIDDFNESRPIAFTLSRPQRTST